MDNLMQLISQTNKSMANFIHTELMILGYNLQASHGNILIHFYNNKSLNYRELSKKTGKSPQTMTTLIRRLVEEDLVEINTSSTDKRNKLVSLTSKGEAIIIEMIRISKDMYTKQYLGIEEPEQKKLKELLTKVIKNFKE